MYLHAFVAVDFLHLQYEIVEVALFRVQLVDEEDDRLLQLLGVAEVVLRAHLRAVLAIDEDHGLVGDVESRDGASHEVVGSRTVDYIEFLVVPFSMENSGEHGISKVELHRHEVGDGVLRLYGSTTLYDSSLIQHAFGKRGLAATFGANERDVLNFVGLINSHIKSVLKLVLVSSYGLFLKLLLKLGKKPTSSKKKR